MMKKQLLWDTLRAVEQVEVTFNQTLKIIDDIKHRYNLVSQMKQEAADRQNSYEAEIQAAISGLSFTKISSGSKKKKRAKKRKVNRWRKSSSDFEPDYETGIDLVECAEAAPFVSVQSNCVYEIKGVNSTKEFRTYRARIQQLHKAAHEKLKQVASAGGSNRRFKQQAVPPKTEVDVCDTYCCSCSCSCECHSYG
ncbi:uncharacterized protein LOC115631762 [Scaptodrosophila lebanonensis]|uniref:Uncharacterized protein LOC115631762 n=1 Tax=Drosophila lebanonensis TaxID=7225 RepID=A0A6J2UB92_DROLE|nr:uncharacterized protein LOC115631762 [Scaptodrosophila lebanonensis]